MRYPRFSAKLPPNPNRVMNGRCNVAWGIDVFVSNPLIPLMLVGFSDSLMVSAYVQRVHPPFASQNQRVCEFVRRSVVSALNKQRPTGDGFNLGAKDPGGRAVLIFRPMDVPIDSFGIRQQRREFGVAQ